MNNPLKYTDPSGYWWNPFKAVAKAWRSVWRGIKKYGRQIASIAVLPVAFASFTEGGVCHALNDIALSIGNGVY
jgi:hypothetical protein